MRRSPRVEVSLPFCYQMVEDVVVGEARHGIRDIGYHGMLAEVPEELALLDEVKLEIELPLLSFRAKEVYARVVKG